MRVQGAQRTEGGVRGRNGGGLVGRVQGGPGGRTRGTRLVLREPCLPGSSTSVPEGAREGRVQGPSGWNPALPERHSHGGGPWSVRMMF